MNKNEMNIAVWFEIPATDFQRAVSFYQTVLELEIVSMDMNGFKQGLFPHDVKALVSGAIVCGPDYTPSQSGSLVYLNGEPGLADALSRVEAAGGRVLMPKTHLGDEIGYIAHFLDSEGNKVGIHSMS